MNFEEMKRQLDGLVVFRELLRDEAVAMFREVLQDRCRNDGDAFTTHCGEFVFRLFQQGDCWTEYLRSAVMESENVCIRNWASGTVTALQERCLDRELAFLDQLSQVTLADLTAGLDNAPAFLEGWRTEPGSIAQDYRQRMQEVGAKGYGIFARYHMFTVENGQLVPVKHPDPQQLEQLPGYEQERQKVIANTQALLDGKPANNVLLYGDAGTGKSSAIKAIANNFAPQGLRLVEVKKNQLYQIPDLMDALAANPEGHSGGQRRRPGPEYRGLRHQQPPPPHQGNHDGPHWRRHPRKRHPAGADEPVRPVRPHRHLCQP